MSQASRIIQKLGGTRKAAAVLGSPVSTVQSWKRAGFIPAKHQAKVLSTARQLGLEIKPEHFFDGPEQAA